MCLIWCSHKILAVRKYKSASVPTKQIRTIDAWTCWSSAKWYLFRKYCVGVEILKNWFADLQTIQDSCLRPLAKKIHCKTGRTEGPMSGRARPVWNICSFESALQHQQNIRGQDLQVSCGSSVDSRVLLRTSRADVCNIGFGDTCASRCQPNPDT